MTERPFVKNRSKWINVYEQTRNHVMPPEGADELGESKRRKMVAWIHNAIHNFDYSTVSNPGFESTRRLTHREYSNTVRDLFGEKLNVISKFPADMSATSGFDNSANSLFIQPLLMEKYIQISEFIAEQIAENQRQTPAVQNHFLNRHRPKVCRPRWRFKKTWRCFCRRLSGGPFRQRSSLLIKRFSTKRITKRLTLSPQVNLLFKRF